MADKQDKVSEVKPKDTKSLTVARLRERLQEGFAQSIFDDDYDGACPCARGKLSIDGHAVDFWSRCWRVSDQIDEGLQDLYVTTDHPAKEKIVELLLGNLNSQEWYNPYKLIEGNDLVATGLSQDEPVKSATQPHNINQREDNV